MTVRYRWTSADVARRAAEHLLAQCERRYAHGLYTEAIVRFKQRRGVARIDPADPAFRRATNKSYAAYQRARAAEYNAARRLATAIRGAEIFLEVRRAAREGAAVDPACAPLTVSCRRIPVKNNAVCRVPGLAPVA